MFTVAEKHQISILKEMVGEVGFRYEKHEVWGNPGLVELRFFSLLTPHYASKNLRQEKVKPFLKSLGIKEAS